MLDPNLAQPESSHTQWPAIVMAISAVAQVVTAMIIVWLTKRLAGATDTYAEQTKALVKETATYAEQTKELVKETATYAALTKVAVDLSIKQYQGDISPMWHLALHATDNEVYLKTHNLSKNSAIVTYLLIRVESEEELEPRKFVLDFGMVGRAEHVSDVQQFILESVGRHIVNGEWDGVLEVKIGFTLTDSAAQIPSPSFRFKVTIREGHITSAQRRLEGISVEARKDDPQ